MKIFKYLFLCMCIVSLCNSFAFANDNDAYVDITSNEQIIDLVEINSTLDDITKKINDKTYSNEDINLFIDNLNSLQSKTISMQKHYTSELENSTKKISALNTATIDGGDADLPEIAVQREVYEKEASQYKYHLAQAMLILTKIDEINNLIIKKRNRELINDILAKQSSIFQPEEFWKSLISFWNFLKDVIVSPITWYNNLEAEQKNHALKSLFILCVMLGFSLIIAIVIRYYIKKHYGYNVEISSPTYVQKFKVAIWIFIANGIIPAFIITAFLAWINSYELMENTNFAILLKNFALYLLYFLIFRAFVLSCFAPKNPDWRIFNIEAMKVKRVSRALINASFAIIAISFFQNLATEIYHEPEIIYSMQIFANAIKATAVVWVVIRVLYDIKDLSDEEVESGNIQKLSLSSQIALFVILFMVVSFGFSLFGYISLSAYLINRFIASVTLICLLYVVFNLLKILYRFVIRRRFWITKLRISPRTLVKSEVWFGIILTPIIYILGILMLLAIWGVSVDILISRTKGILTGFNIGEVHISITSLILGVISFWVAMFLVKMLKNSIQRGNLSKLDFDESMKNSIISGIGFFGFIFSVILGIAVAGGSFKSLAIMAGALSFGAGLGLQNIVSNLVAGITILFERPIKLGDLVIINGYEGTVKQISMRSTVIEAGNKSNIIIPNSAIISGSVVNKTLNNRIGMIDIKVGVAYGSNVTQIKEILLDIANNDEAILKSPAPSVSFLDFSERSLNFQLNAFTPNISNSGEISFRIREQIIKRFDENGIMIPFIEKNEIIFKDANLKSNT